MTDDAGVAFGGCSDIFGAIIDELDRPARFVGKQRGMACDHRRILFLAAEAASGRSLNYDRLFVRQVQELLDGAVDVIRTLHRAKYYHLVFARNRDDPLGLDIKLLLMRDAVLALDDQVCARESFGVAAPNHKTLKDVV